LTDGSFPFPAIGLVHVANRIVIHRPIDVGEKLSLRVWATALEPHPGGQQFSLISEARVGEELVWEEVSTNLRRGGGGDVAGSGAAGSGAAGSGAAGSGAAGSGAAGSGPSLQVPSADELQASATWRLPGDLGRRYGSVSGDLNPIHVHSLSARLFGFPSAIAHGMWTKARCLAALGARLPEAFTVEVAFKPILLPATVEFAQATSADGEVRFGVRDAAKGRWHLDGRLSAG
jgi:acyl dehydratase